MVTKSKAEANARYDAKTYRKINIAFRVEEDADLLESWEKAKAEGLTSREWIRKIFEGN